MDDLTLQVALYFGAALLAGVIIGWLLRSPFVRRALESLGDEWQIKLDNVVRQRDRNQAEIEALRGTIDALHDTVRKKEHAVATSETHLESAKENINALKKDIHMLKTEREDFKLKMSTFQRTLAHVKSQNSELENEFLKSMDFYKSELAKSFEKRKLLQAKIDGSKAEQDSFSNLLQASRSEHESVARMLASAKARLNHLDSLEQDVIRLEAENAQLQHDATRMSSEIETLQRDVAEIDELKVQNKELAHCLESIENSRKQYEEDANRYRERAGESEQHSETLRLRLDEVEKEFANIRHQQQDALQEVRREAETQHLEDQPSGNDEVDNLQEIVGIGKVFEHALHELGIVSFRQMPISTSQTSHASMPN